MTLDKTPPKHYFLIFLFSFTLLTSASLMFILQPLFGKILLPLLGGSPAVWNSCMVFYQTLLFLGYSYAHLISQRLSSKSQILLHGIITVFSLITIPVALSGNMQPPTEGNPTIWIFSTLATAIGLPFFVISTTSPLMQKWFANLGYNDPYFLYAASNIGSLIALLSYPFLIEPQIGLTAQRMNWSIGYGVLCTLILVCGFFLWTHKNKANTQSETFKNHDALSWRVKLHWFLLAFVPSSLLLGLTNFISTDIASVPLLWIIPLTVYLLSFVFVFSQWGEKIHAWIIKLQALFLVPFVAYAFINPADLPYWIYLILHVIAFFFAIMVCHGELAKHRPQTQHLTTYYLIMSFAGMLGGMFNTFIAPVIFSGIYEYPLMIVAALLLRPSLNRLTLKETVTQLIDPALLLIVGVGLFVFVDNLIGYFDGIAISLMILMLFTFFTRKRVITFAGLTGVIIVSAMTVHGLSSNTLMQQRTFFGVLAVRDSTLINEQNQPEIYHELFHGTTKHGAQRLSPELQQIPLTYYSQPSPMGQLFKEFNAENQNWKIGAVGLGAGALACYAKPSQQWTFYEIDPLVVSTAKNTAYFSYLDKCAPNAEMKVGDARLSLEKETDGSFDLLMMDAFSSDAVPTHLLTKEAIELYFKKLKPNGILAFHITNRHLSIKKVLSVHAEQLHLAALIQEFKPKKDIPLVVATDWVVMAKNKAVLNSLQQSQLGQWQKMPLYFDLAIWTDDFTNIIDIWK